MGEPVRLTVQVLSILNLFVEDPEAEWYGLELSRRASLASGTIYPMLARLEAAGWLESRQEDVDPGTAGRPRRRLYRLTRFGVASARAALVDFRSRFAIVNAREEIPGRPLIQPA